MLKKLTVPENLFLEYYKTLLDSIPDIVPIYMKEDKTKDGAIDLDCMLYINAKEIIRNCTTYFLCTEESIDRDHVKSESYTDTIIGVMVIEKNVKVIIKVD